MEPKKETSQVTYICFKYYLQVIPIFSSFLFPMQKILKKTEHFCCCYQSDIVLETFQGKAFFHWGPYICFK